MKKQGDRGTVSCLPYREATHLSPCFPIHIEQCAQYLPGKGVFLKDPKNESSKRLISIPQCVTDILKQHKKNQAVDRLQMGNKWMASDRVFTSWDGRPMYPNEMSSWFPRFLGRHNLPHLNFHGLRHTSATLLIAEGATATDLSRRLGHSTTSTTMNIYAHSLQKADDLLANKMDSILTGKNAQKVRQTSLTFQITINLSKSYPFY
ncbi:hypothetical protein SDC9_69483 [bioreactor metagenome]|uniref:Tyr recombinase domain-containing protein n=1 Tax=bioreactor metagenome TaxID=1076179 RepID=A0A644Y4Z7_9ZZZZ